MTVKRGSPEKEIQKGILEYLHLQYPQIECWKVNSTATYSLQRKCFLKPDKYTKKGVSDIIGIFPNGTWICIEVKVRPKKPTKEQLEFLHMIASHGGVSMWVYSVEDVERMLKEVIKTNPNLLRSRGLELPELEDLAGHLREEMS